jgi:SAM-dependent methyltransferase
MLQTVRRELRDPRSAVPFRMLIAALEEVLAADDLPTPARFLELGCGVGHNGEVLHRMFPGRFEYVGTDYSVELIEAARAEWPERHFEVDNVLEPRINFDEFHIVCPSGLIECLAEYERGLDSVLGSSAPYVVLHRQTIVDRSSRVIVGRAYGRKVHNVELNRDELGRFVTRHDRFVERVIHEEGQPHSTLVLPLNGYGRVSPDPAPSARSVP